MDDSRLVRDLVEANLRLVDRIIELTKVGGPAANAAGPQPVVVTPDLLAGGLDWEDIPEEATAEETTTGARVLAFSRPTATVVSPELPLHMSEEEEDMRWAVAMDQAPPKDLTDLLSRLEAPGTEITMETT